jgi:hypothetical protein
MTRFSFHRLDDGSWGVKATPSMGDGSKLSGQTVTVTKADGSSKTVTLGGLVTRWSYANTTVGVYVVAGARRAMMRTREGRLAAASFDRLAEAALRKAQLDTDAAEGVALRSTLPIHTVRGKPIGPEGAPYGTTHDMDCPSCQDTPFTASPRSETYWSS